MKPQAFQHGEIRDENDKIIKTGAYGKNTPFCTKDNRGILDYIINNLEWLYDKVTNGLSGVYLSLTGGTLTGDVINEAKYVKNAKIIDATATGAGEDEETIVMVRDKNGRDLGFINLLRHKYNKNVQLRHRVINKAWSDLRVVQDDDGNYWAEYAGSNSTNLLISQNDNSNKIPTTAWVRSVSEPKKINVTQVMQNQSTRLSVIKTGSVVFVSFELAKEDITEGNNWNNIIARGLPRKSALYTGGYLYHDAIPGTGSSGVMARLRLTSSGELQLNIFGGAAQTLVGTFSYITDD